MPKLLQALVHPTRVRTHLEDDLTRLAPELLAQPDVVGREAELFERLARTIDHTRMAAAVADIDTDREGGNGR